MTEIFVFFLHGLAYAGLLFLVSSGLTLVFGMMNILNFAHAAFYMLGAYFSYTVLKTTQSFLLSILICPVLLFILGFLVERLLLRRVHRFGHLHELLLTFGLAYIITELVKLIWGNYPLTVDIGEILNKQIEIFGVTYSAYRCLIFGCGLLVALLMSLLIYKTRLGIIIRASVNDSEMVEALGINVPLLFTGVFAAGAALSGFAGVIAGPLLTTYPGMATDILIDAFVVIVVGGFGSLGGAMVASLIIGQLQSFGALLIPKLSLALIYLLMALVLIVKPSGLFGEER
ncbi:branched-chain amino acid ABC transporter permease [Thermodesulforhabdus norvegica]|uniref:Branched-chain amino acid transport system permease protein n=1 Tax=Thermodesulforhabdus norvegica TaxID=39841 RepID=A0A1I4W3C2_9BACT|nr:branched-chain amino acid ABC transporter permease [Thermodesulforhabdus norvegica]SFN07991.1 branched-chain amino acid transport system permease protein [Thermodesulforhabdus norvegica]